MLSLATEILYNANDIVFPKKMFACAKYTTVLRNILIDIFLIHMAFYFTIKLRVSTSLVEEKVIRSIGGSRGRLIGVTSPSPFNLKM